MPSISFRFRARTQSQILDLDNVPTSAAGGIKAREARERIAAAVGTPVDEIEIYFGNERIHEEEVIPFFSCVDVERCEPVKRTPGGGGRGGGGAGGARQPEFIISKTGEAYRVGRGGMLISANRGYMGRGGGGADGNTIQQQETAGGGDSEAEEFKLLQQRMADGVESVSVDQQGGYRGRGGAGRGRGGVGGGGGGAAGGGGADMFNKGPPPPGYVCHNCGNKGHHIEDCPKPKAATGVKRVAPPDGIPESMLIPCSEDDPARCVTRDGRFVKRAIASDLFVAVVVPTTGGAGAAAADGIVITDGGDEAHHVTEVLKEVIGGGGDEAPKTLEEANLLCYYCKKLLTKAIEVPAECCECHVRFCSVDVGGIGPSDPHPTGSCLDRYIASKDDEAICPKCEETFYLDDLNEVPVVREQIEKIKQLLKKRPRSD